MVRNSNQVASSSGCQVGFARVAQNPRLEFSELQLNLRRDFDLFGPSAESLSAQPSELMLHLPLL